jgi:beta-phosphoglucomutase-like phosphatase (HAD superfamily)
VKQGKPHPDIFMEAAQRISMDPLQLIDYSKFLAFEDSLIGVTVSQCV